jgi:hypothetical protein
LAWLHIAIKQSEIIVQGMTEPEPIPFTCSACGANYTIVTIENPTQESGSMVACESCGMPFPAIEGSVALKYFLVKKPKRQ